MLCGQYDASDIDLGDCVAPILPQDNDIELTTADPDVPVTIFAITLGAPIVIPVITFGY